MPEKYKGTAHLLMRFVEQSAEHNSIELHKEVIDQKGHVWLGKVGKPLGNASIEKLKSQIASQVTTYVYLVRRVGERKYAAYRAELRDITTKEPKLDFPNYYKTENILWNMNLFLDIHSLDALTDYELANLVINSTGKSVLETLPMSVISLFLVSSRPLVANHE